MFTVFRSTLDAKLAYNYTVGTLDKDYLKELGIKIIEHPTTGEAAIQGVGDTTYEEMVDNGWFDGN